MLLPFGTDEVQGLLFAEQMVMVPVVSSPTRLTYSFKELEIEGVTFKIKSKCPFLVDQGSTLEE